MADGSDLECVVGIDIGGSRVRAALVAGGALLRRVEAPTPREGPDALLDLIVHLRSEVDGAGAGSSSRVGVAVPGLVDARRGFVHFAANIAGLVDMPLAARLAERLGAPPEVVNDADAAAMAEHLLGAGAGGRSTLYMTISTGIGGGYCAGDALVPSERGWAGEFGHMVVEPAGALCGCGQRGCLETIASGRAIASAATFAYGRPVEAEEVFALASRADAPAVAVLGRVADALALTIANLSRALDPTTFVLGGGVMASGASLLALVRERLGPRMKHFGDIRLEAARFGPDAGLLGAALVAERARPGRSPA